MKITSYNFTYVKPILFNGNKFPSQNETCFLDKYEKENPCISIKDLKEYIAFHKESFKKNDIKGIVGYGGLSLVFDIGNNEVLKCSLENPLEFRTHNSSFDIPFLSPVEKFGETFFVKEPRAEIKNITIDDCKDVIRRIYEANLEPSRDFNMYRTRQIGKINGKAYLLDTRCAVPQPDMFSKFIYNFCSNNKRVFISNYVDFETEMKENEEILRKYGRKGFHIDETPRANLTLRQGLKESFKVIRENCKYKCWSWDYAIGAAEYVIMKGIIEKIKCKIK